ncbi:DUF6064 family protein [Dongia sedimenti]|uniref:DUF6064 family protein n=1 Tax=Dongia sedimenti TaxID=3064282 RepID=A0ABU0YI38_9PROT|nr:DUF6064 family protein [Rhodospirillaceae bacterium R-7]
MSEWWSYSAEDFLLFSPRTYWRMFELQNEAYWPLPVLTLALGGIVTFLAARGGANFLRSAAAILALVWSFVAYTFLWTRYAGINWAIAYVAPAFVLEALLLLLIAVRAGFTVQPRGVVPWTGYLLLAFATVGVPLLAPLHGRDRSTSEIFGIAPDPTVIATLGFLILLRGRFLWLLYPIPILWCLLSGMTLHTMGDAQAWMPFTAVAVVAAAAIAAAVRRPSRTPA